MNAKLLLKTIVLILILFLLVLVGMNNRDLVGFTLPPLLNKTLRLNAAVMYFAFFAIGLLAGTLLTAGGGGKRSSGSGAKAGKSDR